jgi:hypothetical protein
VAKIPYTLERVIKNFRRRDFWTGFCFVPIQASDGADFVPKKKSCRKRGRIYYFSA